MADGGGELERLLFAQSVAGAVCRSAADLRLSTTGNSVLTCEGDFPPRNVVAGFGFLMQIGGQAVCVRPCIAKMVSMWLRTGSDDLLNRLEAFSNPDSNARSSL